jgi:hypothetical protein
MAARQTIRKVDRWGRIALLLIIFSQMVTSAMVKSPAFDEPAHLFRGCLVWHYDTYSGRPIHWLSGLFCLLAPELPAFEELPLAGPAYRNAFFESLDVPLDTLLFPARMAGICLVVILGAVIYRWAKDIDGRVGGLLALTLFAYDPNILAHGRLISSDTVPTLLFTLCLFLYYRALRRRNLLYLLGAAAVLWLALLSKPTAPILLPLLGLMILLSADNIRYWKRWFPWLALLVFIGLLVVGIYGLVPAAENWWGYSSLSSIWNVLEALPRRLMSALRRLVRDPQDERGWPAYMFGRRSFHGWPQYFPLLFLVKTPLPLLVSYIAGLGFLIRDRRWKLLVAFSLPLWLLAAYTRLSLNIGYRHLLPGIPLMTLSAAYALSKVRKPYRLLVGGLVLWAGLGSLRVYPDYLTYFNELAGGPEGGVSFFSDSNLDWGQDLKKLRRWMDEHDVDRIYLSYFGDVNPAAYGIESIDMTSRFGSVYEGDFSPISPPPGVYAISVTHLTGQYLWENPSVFSWFKQQTPIAQIGDTIWVYRVPPDPSPPRWAAVCKLPASEPARILENRPPIDFVEALQEGLDQEPPLDRVVQFDCSQGWPLGRSTDGSAWLLIPSIDGQTPAYVPPVGDRELVYRQENYPGDLLYVVYRWTPDALPAADSVGISAGDVLRLQEAAVSEENTSTGTTVTLSAVWRVLAPPAQPVSFMAHLQHAGGQTVSTQDGAAVPPQYWRSDDRLLQIHRLPLPEGAPAGRYVVVAGVYTVPAIEHLPLTSPEGRSMGETIDLGEIHLP